MSNCRLCWSFFKSIIYYHYCIYNLFTDCFHQRIKNHNLLISASERCELVQENSICSFITEPNGTLPYFSTVEKKFKNYFNHTSQQQAVYELSQHAKLLSLLSGLIVRNPETRNECVQRLAHFLCSLYLPNCRAAIEMSRSDCQKVIDDRNGVCVSFLTSLRRLGYSIKWPPVEVDCNSINISVATPSG